MKNEQELQKEKKAFCDERMSRLQNVIRDAVRKTLPKEDQHKFFMSG